jgi:hypothetical protein
MNENEIERLQAYLRKAFGNKDIRVQRGKGRSPTEVYVGGEFIATLDREDEEGEVSYTLTMSILSEDLG